MSAPAVSVVVPTYQRRESVLRLLRALALQTIEAGRYEVIVSVDGSTDGTYEAVAGFEAPYALRVVNGPNRGRAAAVNAGLRLARGDLIVILDDDMLPAPTFLQAHIEAHAPGTQLGVIGAAPIRVEPSAPPARRYVGAKFNRHLARLARPGYELQLRDFYSGNFSIPAGILREVGGFDEAFTVYGNEDLELSLRLSRAGVLLVYSPRAVAYQSYTKDLAGLARDSIDKGRTAVLLSRKHPAARKYLRLSSYNDFSLQWRLFRASLLVLSRAWPGTPRMVVRLADRAARLWPRRTDLILDVAVDYFFWLGAKSAMRGRSGSTPAARLARV